MQVRAYGKWEWYLWIIETNTHLDVTQTKRNE